LPLGTLVANLVGAFLMGFAIAAFSALPGLSSFWRLLVITGFTGALTTFSTFAAEMYAEIENGRLLTAFAGIVAHVIGSLIMVGFGFAVFAGVRYLVSTT
jgi:CrcB protein